MQLSLADMDYLIIDEMFMVRRKLHGQVEKRLRQPFPHHEGTLFGNHSLEILDSYM